MIIKKLNTVFHRHSRWLFGAFTIIIIVSFLGFLTPGTFGFGDMSNPESISMGTAWGDKVTYGELRDVSRNISVFSEVFNGVPVGRDLPLENVFMYSCMLRKAGSLGLAVSDKEVADLIRRTPAFAKNGSFDKAAYDTAVKNLRRSGLSETDLYAAFRQQIMMDKLQRELTGGISVTPGEAEELYRKLNAKFQVRIIEFPVVKNTRVTDQEIKTFFASRRGNYTIPGKVNALAAACEYAVFRGQAARLATDKNLKAFFDRNPKAFETDKVKDPKFAAVKAAVKARFIDETARELASRKAYDFAAKAYEVLSETPAKDKEKVFRNLADKEKLVIIEAGSADFGAASIGKIKSAALVKSLAALIGGNTVTDPVVEDKAVYIGFSRSRTMPRPAELKEVAARVKADCAADKAAADAFKRATAVYAQVLKAKPAEAARVIGKVKGCKISTFEFSPMDKRPPEAYVSAALAVLNLNAGAFAAPVQGKEASVIAQLVKRTPADMAAFAKSKDMYMMMCRNQKVSLAMQNLQDEFAANCRFTGNGQNN